MDASIYQTIIEDASDAILYADKTGVIRIWNLGAERIFGFSAAEAIGQSLDLIIPEHIRKVHWSGYHRVMETGESRYGNQTLSVPALCKDGRKIFTDFSIVMVKDEAGKVQGIAAIMRDTTPQKERETALRKRIQELEKSTP